MMTLYMVADELFKMGIFFFWLPAAVIKQVSPTVR